MKKILLLILLLSSSWAYSETIVSGILSGEIVWISEESPYVIDEEVIIDLNSTLIIEPGVQILSKGEYWSSIKLGDGASLFCIGSEDHNIFLEYIEIFPLMTIIENENDYDYDYDYSIPGNVVIENTSLYHSVLYFLQMTIIDNLFEESTLAPLECSIIEKNIFLDSSIEVTSGIAQIKNNLFMNPGGWPKTAYSCIEPFIQIVAADDNQPIIIKNTFFLTSTLFSTYAFETLDFRFGAEPNLVPDGTTFDISNNFWMTRNGRLQEEEIPDFLQECSSVMQLEYLPALDAPDSETPISRVVSNVLEYFQKKEQKYNKK